MYRLQNLPRSGWSAPSPFRSSSFLTGGSISIYLRKLRKKARMMISCCLYVFSLDSFLPTKDTETQTNSALAQPYSYLPSNFTLCHIRIYMVILLLLTYFSFVSVDASVIVQWNNHKTLFGSVTHYIPGRCVVSGATLLQ